MTALSPDQRNIAQVFQFPVIYDTMTVYDNLAFPLRNRGVDETTVKRRVSDIAAMLEVEDILTRRASGLSPDNKQKISMGRGLVRDDVNVVMFDVSKYRKLEGWNVYRATDTCPRGSAMQSVAAGVISRKGR